MPNTNEKKYNRIYLTIISILLIVIIILLLFCRFGKTANLGLVATGNVDVFDIDVFCNHIQGSVDTNSFDFNTKTDKFGNVLPTYDKEKDKDVLGIVYVDDKNGNYIYQQRLEIFTNAAFNYTTKIAPGVSNTYNFVVHNSVNTDIKYYIEMYEESEYKVNLKYRLKNGDNYVVGNDATWVSVDELQTAMKELGKGSSDQYSLDWKWFDDDLNDNIAGKNMESEYKLNIRIYFEAI